MRCRPASPADAPRLVQIYAPYVADTAITFATAPLTEADFRHKLEAPYPFLVCEEAGLVQGYAYAAAFREKEAYRWDVELTVYLDPAARGRGLGGQLLRRLLALLRAQGYQQAYSCITLPNERSIALHTRLGFEEIGRFPCLGYKLDAWHDVVWMALPLGDFPLPPREPVPFAALDAALVEQIMREE